MYYDRFDIVMAHYLFCSLWYCGQGDPLYARLCRISRYFKPGAAFNDNPDDHNDNVRAIYNNLIERNHYADLDH